MSVAVVEPRPLVRVGLVQMLGRCDGIRLLLAAARLEDVPAQPHPPDVLLLDLGPDADGTVRRLQVWRNQSPTTRVVVLRRDGAENKLPAGVAAEVHGVLVDPTPERLERVVHAVYRGSYYFEGTLPQPLWRRLHGQSPPVDLRPVEVLLLRLLAGGLSNAEVAGQLGCSLGAAKALLRSVMRKVGARNRAQAAALAARWELLE